MPSCEDGEQKVAERPTPSRPATTANKKRPRGQHHAVVRRQHKKSGREAKTKPSCDDGAQKMAKWPTQSAVVQRRHKKRGRESNSLPSSDGTAQKVAQRPTQCGPTTMFPFFFTHKKKGRERSQKRKEERDRVGKKGAFQRKKTKAVVVPKVAVRHPNSYHFTRSMCHSNCHFWHYSAFGHE